MMHWSVGLVSVVWCSVAVPALAQAPGPVPATTAGSTGAFPAPEPVAPQPTQPPGPARPAPATPGPPTLAPAATTPPAVPPAAPAPLAEPFSEPPPPPPRETDMRPMRERRRFFIGGELGWD